MSFLSETHYTSAHPKAFAVYCSDGRFTEAVEDLLRHLGHARLDTMTMPGGPGLFNAWEASLFEADQARRAAQFLIRGHGIEHVVLLAHAGCGYYRQKYPGRPPSQMRKSQEDDLRVAAREIARTRAGLRIALYYASTEGERVRFDPVTEA